MVTAVVLAAGMSRRMGRAKQLLPYKGRPMLVNVVETLLESLVDEVVVVVGFQAVPIANALQGLPVRISINYNYAAGLSSSIRAGLQEVLDKQIGKSKSHGILFSLADQPLVKLKTINTLVERYLIDRGIVAPYYQGIRGNPVIFDSEFFPELQALSGDKGARDLINCHSESLHKVEVADSGVLTDFDTWDEYCELS